ncbi:MAG TPA: universal stress protein [Acidobacteriota bacterium]|nr:universal stress protein [Acidobacteriota bacterium]
MLPIRRILAPTDFSETSRETVARASELAEHFKAEVLVAHVIPPIPALPPDPHYNFEIPAYQDALHENAERQLKETIASQVSEEVPARPIVRYGDPAKEIVRMAQEEGVDMIVIATHGHTGWQHLVFGSVAEKVIRTARCPVLVVHARELAAGKQEQSD